MKGSEGAFPVSGSASQVVNPGISRREWYVGQMIVSGRFGFDTGLAAARAAAIRTMFEIADELCDEADRIATQQTESAQLARKMAEAILSPHREVPKAVSGFAEIPVESAAALKDIMAAGGSVPLCGPSWAAAPIQAMKACGHPPLPSWRADWGEGLDLVNPQVASTDDSWNPMFGDAKPEESSGDAKP